MADASPAPSQTREITPRTMLPIKKGSKNKADESRQCKKRDTAITMTAKFLLILSTF